MDYEIGWSPTALEDVESIAEYLARDSEYYARAVVDKILVRTRKLKDFPLSGRIVPELEDVSVRETFVHSYRIIYRIISVRHRN
jgi:toxin ParE1/3/4